MTIEQTVKLNTMKLKKNKLQQCAVIFSILLLSACGTTATKPSVKEPAAPAAATPDTTAKPGVGGYYLDDGPGEGAPADIDSIPDAQITNEPPMERSNKAYSALGKQYSPMTSYKPYKKQGKMCIRDRHYGVCFIWSIGLSIFLPAGYSAPTLPNPC